VTPVRSRLATARRNLREDVTLQTILKNASWLTGSSGIVLALGMIQGVLTARLLGVALWGVLSLAFSFAAVVGKLLSFRMNQFVVKWVPQLGKSDTAGAATAFKLAIVADVGSSLVAFAVVEMLSGWAASAFAKNPDFVILFRFAALTTLFGAGRESLLGILQVNRDFHILSVVQVGCKLASLCGIAVVYLTGRGLPAVVAVVLAAEALTAVLMWVFGLRAARAVLHARWVKAPLAALGELGRDMRHFAIMTNVNGTLKLAMSEGDVLVLGLLSSPTEVAFFKLAKSIAAVVYLPMMPLVNATYPELSSAAASGAWNDFSRIMRRGSKLVATWFVPACVGAAVLSPFAISVLYGSAFLPAVLPLRVMLVGVMVDGLLFWTSVSLLSMGEPGYLARITLEAAMLKLVLALVLVPKGGSVAMAVAYSAALIAMNILTAGRVYRGLRARSAAAHAQ
jgi:O-antigen/teichoic acid export membrane protein